MVRITTALLVLLSFVVTPLTSMACMHRCQLFLMHQHPVCHEKAHESMPPHVHHTNHVHVVNQANEPVLAARHEQSRNLMTSWGCPAPTCASIAPAVSSRTVLRSSKLEVASYLRAATVCDSPPIFSQNPSHNVAAMSATGPHSISAPLRI